MDYKHKYMKYKTKFFNLMDTKTVCKQVDNRTQCIKSQVAFPAQHQDAQPGVESMMNPQPIFDDESYVGSRKLKGKVALITGGDSGIGRAVAVAFAKEGADIAVVYYKNYETPDAEYTKTCVEKYGANCMLLQGDLKNEAFCDSCVAMTHNRYSRLDILVLNQAVQFPQKSIADITTAQLHETFATNIYPHFYLAKAALNFLKPGSSIICTASITAYRGNDQLIDYSCTKGAIVSFTKSLSLQLQSRQIRVNAVAPGPVWTPLIVSSYDTSHVQTFGTEVPMLRAGQPCELAPIYVYLASNDSKWVSGQILHVNGGEII